jgi:hypothetical protein
VAAFAARFAPAVLDDTERQPQPASKQGGHTSAAGRSGKRGNQAVAGRLHVDRERDRRRDEHRPRRDFTGAAGA